MKITAIKTFCIDCFRTNWVFVKVETDEGLSGLGEGTLEYKEGALLGAVADLEHALVGRDPFDTEAIWHENYRDAYWRGGPVLMSALSAVDMALWDLKGKALGVSTPGYCIHETLFDDVPWRADVVDEDVRFADGLMYPSDRPGLGIELDEAAAAAHPRRDHWLRHYAGTLTDIRPRPPSRTTTPDSQSLIPNHYSLP